MSDMAKALDDLMRECPGNPEAQAKHMERMLAEVRAYKLRCEPMAMRRHVTNTPSGRTSTAHCQSAFGTPSSGWTRT